MTSTANSAATGTAALAASACQATASVASRRSVKMVSGIVSCRVASTNKAAPIR